MRFTHDTLDAAIDALRDRGTPESRAKWENFRWEGRVAPPRRTAYEAAMPADLGPLDLEERHNNWVLRHVNLRPEDLRLAEPAPFRPDNTLARVAEPEAGELLVRVEDLSLWCKEDGLTPDQLLGEFRDKTERWTTFFKSFNGKRHPWPMFSAFAYDLDARFKGWRDEWSTLLPEMLGLGHLTADEANPRPVALMIYQAGRVLDEPGRAARSERFAAPTTIDHKLNAFFHPSPFPSGGIAVSYGRAVNLAGRGTLACEIIHRHIPYQMGDVEEMAVLRKPVAGPGVAEMRARHLAALRGEAGCAGFGYDVIP